MQRNEASLASERRARVRGGERRGEEGRGGERRGGSNTHLRSKQCAGIALRSVPIVNSGTSVGCRTRMLSTSSCVSEKNEAFFVMAARTCESLASSSMLEDCARMRSDLRRGSVAMT